MKDLTSTGQRARTVAPLALLSVVAAVICLSAWPSSARASDNGNDMVVFAGSQTLQAGQEVDGDLVVIGGNADVHGHVHGDAVAIGGRIYVAPEGQVDGNFVNLGGTIENESATSPGNARSGKHHGVAPPIVPVVPNTTDTSDQGSGSWVPFILFDAALVLFAFLLFPAKTRDAMQYLVENPLIASITGFFSPIILALVLVTLAITIIGIPLIPVVMIMAAVGYLIGKAALAAFVGGRLFEVARVQSPKPIATMLVGLAILAVVSMFGWEGVVIYFCVGAVSLGVALYGFGRVLNQRRRAASYVPPVAPPPAPAHEFAPPAGPTPTGPPAVP
ncbi:MAG: hypothetical protein M3Z37_06840 [Candidatus Eremiobacteraeota bacterium]|nr:hypothetical protein [Candidatus Eremiobacteraeota bacterium]